MVLMGVEKCITEMPRSDFLYHVVPPNKNINPHSIRDLFERIKQTSPFRSHLSSETIIELLTEKAAHEIIPNLFLAGEQAPLEKIYRLNNQLQSDQAFYLKPSSSGRDFDCVLNCSISHQDGYQINPVSEENNLHYLIEQMTFSTWEAFSFENLKRMAFEGIQSLAQSKTVVIVDKQGIDASCHLTLLILALIVDAQREQLNSVAIYIEQLRPISACTRENSLREILEDDFDGASYFELIESHYDAIKGDNQIQEAISNYKNAMHI